MEEVHMKIKKALGVILASTTIFSMTPGTAWAAEELSEEVVIEDEAVSDLEEPETDIEEIQDESDDTDAEVDDFSDEETSDFADESLTEEDTQQLSDIGEEIATFSDGGVKPQAAVIAKGEEEKTSIIWTVYSDGKLEINGYGEMADYTEDNLPEWNKYRDSITYITVDEDVTVIGKYAFCSLDKLLKITIPEGDCVELGAYALKDCKRLDVVDLSRKVNIIGEGAFSGCSGLEKIKLPYVNYVRKYLFKDCTDLESVTIADGVKGIKEIGEYAFSGCSSLTNINISDKVEAINKYAFSGCSSLTNISISDKVTSIGSYAFSRCSNLKSINIPQGVTNIEEGTFFLCENLESITLPENLNQISRSAFSRCSSLNNMDLPKGLKSIGYEAFFGCSRLKSIDIPEGVTSIANSVFEDCSGLEKVNIPEGITTIVSHMFDGCSSLKTITIPKSVTRIENCAFGYCDNLLSIDILGDKLTISSAMILDSEKMRSIRFAGTKEKWDALNVQFANVTVYYNYDPNHEHHYVTESITDVTCTKDGKEEKVCTLCGDFYETIIKAPGHSWNDGEVTTPATCTVKGEKTYTCTVCNKIKTEEIPATGHTEVTDAAVAPTCTAAGKMEGKHCSVCNEVLVAQTEIPALGHSWNDGEVTKKSTCTEAGVKTYTCTVCKETRTEEIEATGHQHIEIRNAEETTCSKEGYTGDQVCKDCDTVVEKGTVIAKKGHTWNVGEVTTSATCEEKGVKTYTCTVCKETKTEEIPAIGHTEIIDNAIDPTCTNPGKIEGSHCSVCNKVLVAQTEIPATGHSWNEGEVTKKPTCTETGVKTYTCTVCKATKTEVIPATGHTEVTDSVIEPTCETIGKTEGSHCSVCNEILVPQKTLEATGHAWGQGKVTKEVTCTEIGEKAYTCSNCGKTRTEEIPAAGHKFGSWTTRNQATVDSPEIQVRSCDICKKEEEREVGSKLEKTMTVSVSSFPLKTRQKTKVLKVTGLAKGDSIISWKSDNTKIVKILGKTNGTSTVTAGKKTGKARITITLKSGLKKVITVSVQKNTVKTKKISGVSKNLKLKRKQKVILHPVIAPLTSAQKITYKSNNTKIVTVNSKGQITAKKKGTAVITVKSGNKTTKCKVTVK